MPSLLPKLLKNLNFSLEDIATLNAIAEYLGKQKLYSKQKLATLEGLQTVAAIESADARRAGASRNDVVDRVGRSSASGQ